jgi:hypothetical protein
MNNFYRPLTYIPNLSSIDFSKFIEQQTRSSPDILPTELHSWINDKLHAKILWIEIFHLAPYQSYKIHCDGHELDNKCKLNYIVNGEDSTMAWYEAVDPNKIISAYSTSNTKYLRLDKNNAREMFKGTLTSFNLVSVGQFHTVYNGNKDRYCLSIVIGDLDTEDRLDFNQVLVRLNNE